MTKQFSSEEIQFLQSNWKRLPDKELAARLNRPVGSICTKKVALGLIGKPGRRGKDWSKEDANRLREHWGYKTVPSIAKILNRTETAIILKAKRLNLGAPTAAGELLTANAVSNLLGVDVHTVTDRWIRKLGLKARKKAFRGDRKMWMIDMNDLIQWLENNQDKWSADKLEMYALGSEPDWLKQKRRRDSSRRKRTGYKWTVAEDQAAIRLFKKGITYEKIGEELNRTGAAVGHRISRLDVWGSGQYIGGA